MTASPRKVRLIDIARRAGISRAAVGHVLNQSGQDRIRVSDETRAKVLRIAEELDYRPNIAAQQLRGKSNKTLGVILDTVNTAVFSDRLSAIEAEARSRGYRLMIGQVHHDPREVQAYLEDFSARAIHGVLCLFDVMQEVRAHLQETFKHHLRAVIHAAPIVSSQSSVRVDTCSAMQLLVDHLVERKRKRIALQLWSMSDSLMLLRLQGWKQALAQHRRSASQQRVWVNPQPVQRPTPEMIDRCLKQLVLQQKADAIIASNDEWAVLLIQGLRRLGLQVPQDVAVTGYDNLYLGEVMEPKLTTIDQCHAEYARAAVDLMLASLDRNFPKSTRTRVVLPRLIVREST